MELRGRQAGPGSLSPLLPPSGYGHTSSAEGRAELSRSQGSQKRGGQDHGGEQSHGVALNLNEHLSVLIRKREVTLVPLPQILC